MRRTKSTGVTAKRYSDKIKKEAAELILSGKLTMTAARRKYKVSGSQTIPGWIRRYEAENGSKQERSTKEIAAPTKTVAKAKKAPARKAGGKKTSPRKVQKGNASPRKAQPQRKSGAKKAGRKRRAQS